MLLLLLMLSFCASIVYAEPPHPPFRKVWSYKTHEQIYSSLRENTVDNRILCYYTSEEYGAVDIGTGKCLWKKPVGKNHILQGRCFKNRFCITLEKYDGNPEHWNSGKGTFYILDPYTGREISSLTLSEMECHPDLAGGILYCLFELNRLAAIDIATGKRLWERQITLSPDEHKRKFIDIDLNAVGNSLFIKNSYKEMLCVNTASGETRWKLTLNSSYPSYTIDSKRFYLLHDDKITALNIDNGRKEWEFTSENRIENRMISTENLVVFIGKNGFIYALAAENGSISWSQKLPPAKYRISCELFLMDGSIILTLSNRLLAFDLKGNRLWEFDNSAGYIAGISSLEGGYLINTGHALIRYEEGEPPALPDTVEGKKALAEKLVSRFDDLDDDEDNTLTTLGDQAFDALLSLVKKHLSLYEKAALDVKSRTNDIAEQYNYISKEYSKFNNAIFALQKVITPKHTTQLFSLLSIAKNPKSMYKILFLLSEKGDDKITAPYFIKEIKKLRNEKDDLFYVALHALENSSNKAAVDFMIDKLSDPKASKAIREAAYLNLGRTGGERGVRAVIKARDESRTIPSLDDFARFDQLDMTVNKNIEGDPDNRLMQLMTDSKGDLWGIVSSSVLGSFLDLWLLKSDGRKWKQAFFAGSLTDSSDITIESMIDSIDSTGIPKDSDKDGWTDLVEKRLGTDPNNKDTDGDGLIDSEDKNPLAIPRPLNEEEKVLRAAFEARYCFSSGDGYKTPCLVDLPEGVQPFEFYGFNWVIIPQVKGTESPLAKYRTLILHRGMAVVYFGRPRNDFDGNATPETRGRDFILWNADRTEARLSISTHYGSLNAAGYDIHLKKFGDEWIVIKMLKTWVS